VTRYLLYLLAASLAVGVALVAVAITDPIYGWRRL